MEITYPNFSYETTETSAGKIYLLWKFLKSRIVTNGNYYWLAIKHSLSVCTSNFTSMAK